MGDLNQQHDGVGDNVGGDKIERQFVVHGDFVELEQPKVDRFLTSPPFLPPVFLGREYDLSEIHARFVSGQACPLLLLTGEGGMGKTSLAAKYWEAFESTYVHLAWVFAGHGLQDGLLALAPRLGLKFEDTEPDAHRLDRLFAKLANLGSPSLLVVDNENNPEDLALFYGALVGLKNFHILVTTRVLEFENVDRLGLPPLSAPVALEVFKEHYARHAPSDDALFENIYAAVGGNTLVLELLGKNLQTLNRNHTFYTFQNLLDDLLRKGLFAVSQTAEVSVLAKGQRLLLKKGNPIDVIGALYDEIEMGTPLSDAEKRLLSNLAVLPFEPFAFGLLAQLLVAESDREGLLLLSHSLDQVAQRGWIERVGVGCFKMSPVVAEIVRKKNGERLQGDCEGLVFYLIQKLKYKHEEFQHCPLDEARPLIGIAENLTKVLVGEYYHFGRLYDRVGFYQSRVGNLPKAIAFFEQEIIFETPHLSANPNNLEVQQNFAFCISNIGDILLAMGRLDEASVRFQLFLEMKKTIQESQPSEAASYGLLVGYCKLGEVHLRRFDFEEAQASFEKMRDLGEQFLLSFPGSDLLKGCIATAYGNLGEIHFGMNQLLAAREDYSTFHKIYSELSLDHPTSLKFTNSVAISLLKLGAVNVALGDIEVAISQLEESNRLQKSLFATAPEGIEYRYNLALSYFELAEAYLAKNNLDQAREIHLKNLTKVLKLLDQVPEKVSIKDHVACVYCSLGIVMGRMGDRTAAEGYFNEAIHHWKALSDSQPDVIEFKRKLQRVDDLLADLS
jgi:tetratricopeptide (TPR) repeat protein